MWIENICCIITLVLCWGFWYCFFFFLFSVRISSRPPATLPRPCAPSLSHTGLRPIATPTQAKNNQSAELSCPDTFLQPTTTPTQYENNQSAEPYCPDTYLHPNAAPIEHENNQSAEPSYPNTYLHHIATHTEYENNQSADCLELDEGGYLKPMDLLQKQLICQTKVWEKKIKSNLSSTDLCAHVHGSMHGLNAQVHALITDEN